MSEAQRTKLAPDGRPWNPYYRAYANANGRTPAQQQAHDKEVYPGGSGAGFILWMREQRAAFRRASPGSFFRDSTGRVTHEILDHKAWASWLAQYEREDL